jgi:hypothetical protein
MDGELPGQDAWLVTGPADQALGQGGGFSLNRNRCRIIDNSAGNRQPKEEEAQIYPGICPS